MMQASSHQAGQGGMINNAPQLAWNGMPTPAIGNRGKPWHSKADTELRHGMLLHIMKVFYRPGSESNLPNMLRLLEEALYYEAASREEYADLKTLQQRIQALILRMRMKHGSTQHILHTSSAFSKNTEVSSVGYSSRVFNAGSSTMIPTPGIGSSISDMGGEGFVVNAGGNRSTVACELNSMNHMNIMASCQGLNTTIFSTDGVISLEKPGTEIGQTSQRTQLTSSSPSAGLSVQNVRGSSFNQMKQNLIAIASGDSQMHGNLNDKRNTNACFRDLMHNSTQFLDPSGYLSSAQCSTLQSPKPISHLNSQMQYGFNDGFSRNVADLDLSGSLHNIVLPARPTCPPDASSLASLSASSFPFPSSLWQQHDSLSQKHYSQSLQNQFSHELLQKDDVKQGMSLSMNMQQHQLPSRSMISANDVGQLNGGFTESPYNSLPSQDTVEKLVHTQHQPQMMEVSAPLLQKAQVGKHCKEQHHKQPVYLQIVSQENQIPDERLEQNEQVCQATAHSALSISNDAGQPEVVSNNESLGARQISLEPSISRTRNFQKQRLWLLYLRHASRCTLQEGECVVQHCSKGRQLWAHICSCHDRSCSYAYCVASKTLLIHHQRCRNVVCPVCAPVRNVLSRYKMQRLHSQGSQGQVASSITTVTAEGAAHKAKRVKIEVSASSAMHLQENSQQSMLTVEGEQQASHYSVPPVQQHRQVDMLTSHQNSIEARNSNSPDVCRSGQFSFKESSSAALLSIDLQLQDQAEQKLSSKLANHREVKFQIQVRDAVSKANSNLNTLQSKLESSLQAKQESVASVSVSTSDISPISSTKTAKIKVPGISYIEFLDVDIIKQNIYSLRQWIGQSKAKAEKNQALGQQMVPDACPACAVEKIYFEPSPIYCTSCGVRVKRNAVYYTAGSGDTRLYYCIPCYNNQADIIKAGVLAYKKSSLEKRKNDEQQEEAWVECDKCKKWQHQICALFNVRINDCDRAEYTCPDCCIAEIERGERVPYSQDTVLGAKDLPRTFLSDYIEERLTLKLDQERIERAKAFGKSPNEVPGADGLVVRVVSSVDKKLEVKKQFFELFREQGYPAEFPYKSKMLLLFQKIEGVEVCLFGMYVQEFGANCSQPNQRRVYLAYLDSVKYFRPDIKTVNGEALRTFVYHEILIGYLDYCKKRGFTSCYIWACPPLKGEDYILYCHPEIQKTPKSDKLREWYLTMIRKAKKESIVIANRNIHDYFFSALGECKVKMTAARLPYFDGDYLPGAAEDIISQLQEEEGKSQKRGNSKKFATKRFGKGFPEDGLSSNEYKDRHLMQKLGDSIHAMREDFIMVHLQHTCTHCRGFVISGNRWVCQKCSNDFQLCDICYAEERKLTEEERHPAGKKEMHALVQIEEDGVPADTQDRDEAIESEIFDTRHAFLSLCQGNHYQYDTLRRAKHSSMMVLYHLHNPNAPPFTTSCNVCNRELEGGQGWKCETCSDYDVCTACYSLPEVQKHPHKLVQHSSAPGCTLQNKESRQQQLLQLRKMLELLVHASQCYQSTCQHPKCRSMKELFRHGNQCKIRLQKGCGICKRMWYLLRAHARSCTDRACHVPRCCDLKDLSRRYQLQQESRRRAAVNEMMRQRAAEAAEESG